MGGTRTAVHAGLILILVIASLAWPATSQVPDEERRVTIEGPTHGFLDESATYHGRYTLAGHGLAFQELELYIGWTNTTRVFTDALGHWEATVNFERAESQTLFIESRTDPEELVVDHVYDHMEVDVDARPDAAFGYTPTYPVATETVTLEDASEDPDGTIVSRSWTLGDGTDATGPVIDHAYASPGDHRVDLTVTDDDGYQDRAQGTVSVEPLPSALSVDILDLRAELEHGEVKVYTKIRAELEADGAGVEHQALPGDVTLTNNVPCWGWENSDSGCIQQQDRQSFVIPGETDESGTIETWVGPATYPYASRCDTVDVELSASFTRGEADLAAGQTESMRACV